MRASPSTSCNGIGPLGHAFWTQAKNVAEIDGGRKTNEVQPVSALHPRGLPDGRKQRCGVHVHERCAKAAGKGQKTCVLWVWAALKTLLSRRTAHIDTLATDGLTNRAL
jgi:hypothetical protein